MLISTAEKGWGSVNLSISSCNLQHSLKLLDVLGRVHPSQEFEKIHKHFLWIIVNPTFASRTEKARLGELRKGSSK